MWSAMYGAKEGAEDAGWVGAQLVRIRCAMETEWVRLYVEGREIEQKYQICETNK